ncbi:hypothetical protein T484DRAFT_1852047 [Baffinella frigidus]|nr:hypothetical protein T484DRAFT_1852047 [Cryptophyta sp. CCMP2293]
MFAFFFAFSVATCSSSEATLDLRRLLLIRLFRVLSTADATPPTNPFTVRVKACTNLTSLSMVCDEGSSSSFCAFFPADATDGTELRLWVVCPDVETARAVSSSWASMSAATCFAEGIDSDRIELHCSCLTFVPSLEAERMKLVSSMIFQEAARPNAFEMKIPNGVVATIMLMGAAFAAYSVSMSYMESPSSLVGSAPRATLQGVTGSWVPFLLEKGRTALEPRHGYGPQSCH